MNRNDLEYRVLGFFDSWKDRNSLGWCQENGHIIFNMRCNDLFYWACADCEDITEENFPLLEQTWDDLKSPKETMSHDQIYYHAALFCARSRKMRPQKPFLEDLPSEMRVLFEACGPERD